MFPEIALCLLALSVHRSFGQSCVMKLNLKVNEIFEFTSPGYPENYTANLDCSWVMTAPLGNKVTIFCSEFVIPGTICDLDQFTINGFVGDTKYCSSNPIFAQSRYFATAELQTKTNQGRFSCKATYEPDHCDCGRGVLPVNGKYIEKDVHFQAYLQDSTGVRCSATIISPNYAMTAARCVTEQKAANLTLVVGSVNFTVEHSIKTLTPHENYDPATGKNDIALIRLNEDILYNEEVGPVCLPWKFKFNETFENDPVTIAGLQEIKLNTTTHESCKTDNPNVDDTMICTIAQDKESCQNDYGASVNYRDNSIYRLFSIGVVSSGPGCGSSKASAQTRVTSHLDWINNNAVGAQFCKNPFEW